MDKLKIPMPRSGVTAKSRKIDHARSDGYIMALLCGLATLNDLFRFTDEEMRLFVETCNYVLKESIVKGRDDPKYIIRDLSERTGFNITFSDDV